MQRPASPPAKKMEQKISFNFRENELLQKEIRCNSKLFLSFSKLRKRLFFDVNEVLKSLQVCREEKSELKIGQYFFKIYNFFEYFLLFTGCKVRVTRQTTAEPKNCENIFFL